MPLSECGSIGAGKFCRLEYAGWDAVLVESGRRPKLGLLGRQTPPLKTQRRTCLVRFSEDYYGLRGVTVLCTQALWHLANKPWPSSDAAGAGKSTTAAALRLCGQVSTRR